MLPSPFLSFTVLASYIHRRRGTCYRDDDHQGNDVDPRLNPVTTISVPTVVPTVLWEGEDDKQLFVFRGNMTIEYQWLNDKKFGRREKAFIKEAQQRFNDDTIESIEDLKGNPEYWSEVDDRIKYTFNASQKLKVV